MVMTFHGYQIECTPADPCPLGPGPKCDDYLEQQGYPHYAPPSLSFEDESLWCNSTFDGLMCWPAIKAGTSITAACPDIPSLDYSKTLTKDCHESGRWAGFNNTDFSTSSGYTPFIDQCLMFPLEIVGPATDLAARARIVEFLGLTLSLLSLGVSVLIFCSFRRLRVFRTQLHLNLMVALLAVVFVRLCIYIDQGLEPKDSDFSGQRGIFIHKTFILCELAYVLLEYFKTTAFGWMFMEGFYLCNSIVLNVFSSSEPRLWKYMIVVWGGSLLHTVVWLVFMLVTEKRMKNRTCLHNYYLLPSFWIQDGVRLLQLGLNLLFIISVIWVLWRKVKEQHNAGEISKMKKSVKAAFMLIPLLGLPNIFQTIPYKPTVENFPRFQIYTYVATFFYMYQGLMIAIIYCFTNSEVINALSTFYARVQLRRSSGNTLRNGHTQNRTRLSPSVSSVRNRLHSVVFKSKSSASGPGQPHRAQQRTGSNIEPDLALHAQTLSPNMPRGSRGRASMPLVHMTAGNTTSEQCSMLLSSRTDTDTDNTPTSGPPPSYEHAVGKKAYATQRVVTIVTHQDDDGVC